MTSGDTSQFLGCVLYEREIYKASDCQQVADREIVQLGIVLTVCLLSLFRSLFKSSNILSEGFTAQALRQGNENYFLGAQDPLLVW